MSLTKQEQAIKKAVEEYATSRGAKLSASKAPRLKHSKVVVVLDQCHNFGIHCQEASILQWRPSHPYSLYGYKMISFAGKMVPQLTGVTVDFLFNKVEVV